MIVLMTVFYRRTGRAGNKGTAFTFVTPEQPRYAGEIIKALEMAGTTVPDDLRELWDSYVKQAEAVSSTHIILSN